MKNKIISLTLLLFFAFASNLTYAQLGEPKITVKDTLMILSVSYNETIMEMADWPASFIVEDPVYIYVAGYKYKKNKPTYKEINMYNSSWKGHIDCVLYADAKCNGQKQQITIIRPYEDCEINYISKYVIGDYDFIVLSNMERYLSSKAKQ